LGLLADLAATEAREEEAFRPANEMVLPLMVSTLFPVLTRDFVRGRVFVLTFMRIVALRPA
jgi:hypothetical protein